MFNFLKEKISKIYTSVTKGVQALFSSHSHFDEGFIEQLTALLLAADTGVATTNAIIERLKAAMQGAAPTDLNQAKSALEKILTAMLEPKQAPLMLPRVLVMVGINGSGKTTFIAKYAALLKKEGKRVLVVAGDTFRAAASEQLGTWAERIGAELFVGKEGQDPASVVFDACERFKQGDYDHIIIDTAGRLQTKVNLMKELEKIKKIITRQLGDQPISTWLTIDAMLGQNSLSQATLFHEATQLNGLVLTKMDGTGKGGTLFAITQQLGIPISYITFGEQLDDLKAFNPADYVHQLLNS